MPGRDFEPIENEVIAELDGMVAFPPGSQINLASLSKHITSDTNKLTGDVLSYQASADWTESDNFPSIPTYPTAMPGWDNTARRGKDAYIFHGSNPLSWANNLRRTESRNSTDTLFINAWNEWAEGAVLEKCDRFNRGYGRAIQDVR
jgi:hypothetical protein